MNHFLKRISSRKFLVALSVQIAAVAALFKPGSGEAFEQAAVQIASLVTMLLAALGYGKIEGNIDKNNSNKD